jgi:hypothetical protein
VKAPKADVVLAHKIQPGIGAYAGLWTVLVRCPHDALSLYHVAPRPEPGHTAEEVVRSMLPDLDAGHRAECPGCRAFRTTTRSRHS